jgi:hypothetical protein
LPIVDATAVPESVPVRLKNAASAIRLARRQDLRRDDRRDRIRGIMEAVDVFEGDRREDDTDEEPHTAMRTRLRKT